MAAPTLRPGDAWRIEIAGNPMFFSIKRLLCATGAALLRLALGWSPLLALRGGYLWKIECATCSVPSRLAIQACSLHWNGCFHAVCVCSLGWGSSFALCKADRSGIASSRWRWWGWKRTK
jgi:hypothetical protein